MERAAELEIPAVALLDRDGLSGAVRFHKAGRKRGVRALLGAEVTAAEGTFRYPLLCASRKGYQNLCSLLTKIKLERRAGATPTDLAEYAEGLVLLAGDPLAALGYDRAAADRFIQIFSKTNVYVDLENLNFGGSIFILHVLAYSVISDVLSLLLLLTFNIVVKNSSL